ncbi:MAG: VWA domain-containing protein [bacterium]
MRFANSWVLWFFWILPLLIFFYWVFFRWQKKALARFGVINTITRLIPSEVRERQKLKAWLMIMALACIWFAAAGPQLGARLVEVHRRGIDVLIAVDCSQSMLAEDIKPNRLARAKLALSSLIESLEGDRVGIIAFAGAAFLQCPLTLDYSAAKMFLDFLSVDLIPRPGTAMGEAIALAIKSFSRKERKYKVLVLITDGEDHKSNPLELAREASREGIKILTVGIGSTEGEPIPVRDGNNAVSGYKKDRSGNIIMSKLDETTLQKIALETGGTYFRATSGGIEIEGIIEEIARMEKKELQSRLYNQYENRYQFFLFLAVICLLIEFILPGRGRIFSLHNVCAGFILLMLVSPADAGVRKKVNHGNSLYNAEKYQEALDTYRDAQIDEPESPALHFNTGNTLYRSGNYEEAYTEYQKSADSKDINIQAEAYYNMGNALYRSGKLPESILHYRKSLELNEQDQDAKYNIEYVQKKLKEMADQNKDQAQQQEQQQEQQQSGQQNQDHNQQNKEGNQDNKEQEKNKNPSNKDEQNKNNEDEKQEKKPKKGSMSKEDAERLLNSEEDQEREAQKKRQQAPSQGQGVVEDW